MVSCLLFSIFIPLLYAVYIDSTRKITKFDKHITITAMKILLDIKDDKALYLLEVLKGLSFVKTKVLTDEKALLMSEIHESVENLKLVKAGKLKARPAKDLLDEL